ncbi:MAG: hypothetical protein SWK76_09355 [Actinomycetota bacterium]|nr:hypothetical protein [Actinomycetota bacterium]
MKEESYRCAYCDKKMPSGSEVFGLGVRLKEGMGYPSEVGRMTQVELPLKGKAFKCMVTADGSRAKMEGWDLVFVVCCEKCGDELKDILEAEDLFEEIM